MLKVSSQFGRYEYRFALDGSTEDQVMHTTADDLILYSGYTGAYLGLFSTANDQRSS